MGWDLWALQAIGGIREGLARFPRFVVVLAPHPGGVALRDLIRWFPQSALRIASTTGYSLPCLRHGGVGVWCRVGSEPIGTDKISCL